MSQCSINNSTLTNELQVLSLNKEKPSELYNDPFVIAINPDPHTQALKRGQYRITLHSDQPVEKAKQILDTQVSVPLDGDLKRIQFYKMDMIPDGNGGTNIKAIVGIMDNQFIIGGIILAVGTIGGLLSGSLFVSKVEEFSQSVTGKLVEIGSIVISLVIVYYTFIKK